MRGRRAEHARICRWMCRRWTRISLAFSGHKVYGPMGIGVLYGKRELLETDAALPHRRRDDRVCDAERAPSMRSCRTSSRRAPSMRRGAAGLARGALNTSQSIGFDIDAHERELALTAPRMEGMRQMPHVHILGSDGSGGAHGHRHLHRGRRAPARYQRDSCARTVSTIRAGHHCAQPLLKHLGCLPPRRGPALLSTIRRKR